MHLNASNRSSFHPVTAQAKPRFLHFSQVSTPTLPISPFGSGLAAMKAAL